MVMLLDYIFNNHLLILFGNHVLCIKHFIITIPSNVSPSSTIVPVSCFIHFTPNALLLLQCFLLKTSFQFLLFLRISCFITVSLYPTYKVSYSLSIPFLNNFTQHNVFHIHPQSGKLYDFIFSYTLVVIIVYVPPKLLYPFLCSWTLELFLDNNSLIAYKLERIYAQVWNGNLSSIWSLIIRTIVPTTFNFLSWFQ